MQSIKKIIPKFAVGVGILFVVTVAYLLIRGNVVRVEAKTVEEGELIQAIYATGSIDADAIANLRNQITGTVNYVGAKEGEAVKKGQKILAIDERDYVIALATARARLAEQKILLDDRRVSLERNRNLFKSGAIPRQSLDDAERNYAQAEEIFRQKQLALNQADDDLTKTKIIAPIDGVLTLQVAKLGDYLVQNTLSATIVDTTTYNVSIEVDELDVPRIKIGQETIVALDAIPDSRFKARVARIVPQTDLIKKTSKVYLKLSESVPGIQVGMTATANIIYNVKPKTIIVDKAAIVQEKKQSFVWKVSEKKLAKQEIKTGATDLKSIEVLGGLSKGDTIVINPKEDFKDGNEAEITNKPGKKENAQ
ncbi:MAG: efflux RND transporter periplasmic adaptor subunit [Chlorobiales bacterium]|jgi:RND family efflux transporter MFP subunit|nr:efflux RND transporter periplasmic adaptor subunit [Chlorobiales bacterium]